jgi:hypothetical protein
VVAGGDSVMLGGLVSVIAVGFLIFWPGDMFRVCVINLLSRYVSTRRVRNCFMHAFYASTFATFRSPFCIPLDAMRFLRVLPVARTKNASVQICGGSTKAIQRSRQTFREKS